MNSTCPSDEQTTLWNGAAGHAWVEAQELLDHMFRPFEDLLVQAVSAEPRGPVLDVGCGTGSTTLAVAARLGNGVPCTGIDISEPMLAAARARAERESSSARFIRADAANHAFEPQSFASIISRFGVMFFDDPVSAFANLRRAARTSAQLRLIAWRSAAENPFMTRAERAAAPLLPNLPARIPEGPGQFAFAEAGRVARILEASGWTEIDIQPIDETCALPRGDLMPYITKFGPVGRALQTADDATRAQVIERVGPAFAEYAHGAEIRFTAACWSIGARAPNPNPE